MYFNYNQVIDIDNLINSDYKFYAHKKKCNNEPSLENKIVIKETLKEHTLLCQKYFKGLCEEKGLEQVFSNFEQYYFGGISDECRVLFKEILINTIGFHDVGKINPYFQIHNMDNPLKEDVIYFSQLNTKHSIISSVLYIDYYLNRILQLENKEEKKVLRTILFVNAYIISKHHSSLDKFEEFLNSFIEGKDSYKVIDIFENHYKKIYLSGFTLSQRKAQKQCRNTLNNIKKIASEKSIYLYTYCRLVYSLLVACDYYATTEFMNGTEIQSFGDITEIDEIYDVYKNTNIYKSIRKYEKDQYNKQDKNLTSEKNINILRNEMFLDAEHEIINHKDKNIFFLEAPTGSGKSNVSMNLSFKLIEDNSTLKKIIDVYPFNTLVEQNISSLSKTFGENKEVFNKIAVINSVFPIKSDDNENNFKDYAKALLNRQFLNYPIILTTHVSLFDIMFGASRESSFAFHQLVHSVIVLDEIQSYKNIIWSEIIAFLNGFSKILDMKVIIMSATLPDLKMLLNEGAEDGKCTNLILDREKYFSNPLFKSRVNVSYELLDSNEIQEELYNHVLKNVKRKKKILIEFIKKQSAYEFYNRLKELFDESDDMPVIELMTGDDNVIERNRILETIKSGEAEEKGMILTATQVIEAGVDIDMDIGYKDISKLDSEEQFLGRINRSCRKDGEVYFFDYDKVDSIYKNDIRTNKDLTLSDEKMKEILINKDFSSYYNLVLNRIRENYNEKLNEDNLEMFFKESVGVLDFKSIEERMRLIDDGDWNMSVYLARIIEKKENDSVIQIDGAEVWNDYKKLLMDNSLDYSEKQVKLSEVKSLMNYFIYEIKKTPDLPYNDKIGELYYIENGDKYFDGEKLDKEKFVAETGLFLDL